MFVNSIIVAMKAHVNQPCLTIYHVGTSYRNPVTFTELRDIGFQYFTENPWSNSEGNLVKVRKGIALRNIWIFEIILFLWQLVLQMVSFIFYFIFFLNLVILLEENKLMKRLEN